MKIFVVNDYAELSSIAYGVMKEVLLANPKAVLGLATGSSPVGLYKLMAEGCAKGEISFNDVRTVNLDEYAGLSPDHPQSYHYFMKTNLFDHVNLPAGASHVPDGAAADLEAACKDYDALLEALPRDIQLLGIGSNGHIAFNEPGTPFDRGTHIVKLKESTIRANARFFESEKEVPRRAITMGFKGIMAAKKLLLVATGTNKAQAVAAAVTGPVDVSCPASILQKHPDVVLVLDKDAASKLSF